MNPVLNALLQSWDWRISVIIVLALAGTFYTIGWSRLKKAQSKNTSHQLASGWRLASYWGGLFIIAVALMSPIDVLGAELFTFHMIQHLLLMMFAPPLLLLANPFPFFMWSLPKQSRRPISQAVLGKNSPFRKYLVMATGPGVVWLLFIVVFIGWHDSNLYNLALQNAWVHDLEHWTFFLTSLLFWWHVIGAGPHIHKRMSPGLRIAYVLITIPFNMLTGIFISFSSAPIYTYYETVPRFYGLDVMQDQMIGGIIMWVPGSMMYIIAALILVAVLLKDEEAKPPLPESEWATDEAMRAPGWNEES